MPTTTEPERPTLLAATAAEGVAQTALALVTGALQAIVTDLRGVYESLGDVPDAGAMADGAIPESIAFHVEVAIECVLADYLQPAIHRLGHAAIVSPGNLFDEWEAWKKRRPAQ